MIAPYRGRKAEIYDQRREGTRKWRLENEAVERMIGKPKTVLDVPVGTGRFLQLWRKIGCAVIGLDTSEQMLRQAAKKNRGKAALLLGDATRLDYKNRTFDTVVCVRLLHLVDEYTMTAMLQEVCRVARNVVILTIQLGESYSKGGGVVHTHSDKKFRALVKRCGFEITETAIGDKARNWLILKLMRTK